MRDCGERAARLLTASFSVLFQQRAEKSLPVAEIRAFKSVKHIYQIDQATIRGQIENAERSGDFGRSRLCGHQ